MEYVNIPDPRTIREVRVINFIRNGDALEIDCRYTKTLSSGLYNTRRLGWYLIDKEMTTRDNGAGDDDMARSVIEKYGDIFGITAANIDMEFDTDENKWNFLDYILGVLKKDGYDIQIVLTANVG